MEMLRALISCTLCTRRKLQAVPLDADYNASSKIDRSQLLAMRAMCIERPKAMKTSFSDDSGDISTASGDLNELTDTSDHVGLTPDGSDEDMLHEQRVPPGLEDQSDLQCPLAGSIAEVSQRQGNGENPTPLRSYAMPFVPGHAVSSTGTDYTQGDYVSYSQFAELPIEGPPNDFQETIPWELSYSAAGHLTQMVPVFQVPVPVAVQSMQSLAPRRARRPFTPFTGSTMQPGGNRCAGPGTTQANSKAGNTRAVTMAVNSDEGLKAHLHKLTFEDKDCVIMVKKISKLGLESASLLEVFFSRYGAVKKVYVSHVHEKIKGTDRVKVRPAGIAFVVFERPDAVVAAYQKGTEQQVLGVYITLGPFESKLPKELREGATA